MTFCMTPLYVAFLAQSRCHSSIVHTHVVLTPPACTMRWMAASCATWLVPPLQSSTAYTS